MISRKNILELDTRRKIYNYILKNPGSYEREISKKMGIPKSTLRHHLITLNKRELISSKKDKGYTRYYAVDKIGKKEKEILAVLKQDIPRNILLYLLYYAVCSQSEISKAVEKKPSTINYHLKKLIGLNLIEIAGENFRDKLKNNKLNFRKKNKNEILYKIIDRETNYIVYDLLIICKDSVSDKEFLNSLLFTEESIKHFQKRIPKKYKLGIIQTPEQQIDNVINALKEIISYPYYW
jgi:predicted transcriptional regulator